MERTLDHGRMCSISCIGFQILQLFLSFPQIMEKLVDIVTYLHQAILEAFGNNGMSLVSFDKIRWPYHEYNSVCMCMRYA